MANDGYAVAKELRKMNVDVDLAINVSDFGMALPQWEETEISDTLDPFSLNLSDIKDKWNSPSWIRYFDFLNKVPKKKHLIAKINSRINIIKMIREYDIVETHVPWAIYSQFSGIPYVTYDAGWVRYFPYGDSFRNKLARRGYKKAKKIILTNPDTYEIFDKLSYLDKQKMHFVPFAIDPEKYKPFEVNDLQNSHIKKGDFLLFSPSRQSWGEKGNDKMIRAFAKFQKVIQNSKFIIVAWSLDEHKSKELVNTLGISDKIIWIKPVPKNQLIKYYDIADVVLDQFTLGSWGTSTPEAMSCGKPVIMYYKENYILRAFGELPPILNSFTEDEIYSNLLILAKDPDLKKKIGYESREWVKRTHGPRVVAQKHLEILQNAIKN
jgi:glycosyltransferase involved in cell wall biosynthesis